MDLGEVQHHGQLVYQATAGHGAGGHHRGDAQLPLQKIHGQLVVVNRIGLIQRRHVTETRRGSQRNNQMTIIKFPILYPPHLHPGFQLCDVSDKQMKAQGLIPLQQSI